MELVWTALKEACYNFCMSNQFSKYLTLLRRSLLAAAVLSGLAGCLAPVQDVPLTSSQPLPSVPPVQEERIATTAPVTGDSPFTAYFTEPNSDEARSRQNGIDFEIITAIDQAQTGIDIAVLNFNLRYVANALVDAHRRGVRVRVVVDDQYLDRNVPRQLAQAGIEVIGDRDPDLMHHKFIIIDGQEVWTGSMNLTVSGTYDDANNLVRVQSQKMAEDFTWEFEQMFAEGRFGDESTPKGSPYPRFELQGRPVEVLFSPGDDVTRRLVELVRGARESVTFMAFSLTSDDLADALIDQKNAGIIVQGVMDAEQVESNFNSQYDRLVDAGVVVRTDTLEGQMHHKVLIIDRQVVEFGSFNFSNSAEYENDENVVIVKDSQLAGEFTAEFMRIFGAAAEKR